MSPSMISYRLYIQRACAWLAAAVCVFAARDGYGVQVDFQLTGTNSLQASPFVNAVASPMVAQDPGGNSLKTTYTGTITVDVDSLTNPTTITFVSAQAVAANSGNWLPQVGGGTVGDTGVEGDANPGTAAPANYGLFLDYGPGLAVLYGAVRDSIFSFDAAAQPVVAGQFDPHPLHITVPQGTFDSNLSSNVFGDSAGTQSITDLMAMNCATNADTNNNNCGGAMGSYSVSGNLATLTVPIDFRIGGGTPVTGFTGTFVATYSLGVPGDYNANGVVDGADYVLWRDGGPLQNEVDTPGTVNAADYTEWRARFGNTSGAGAGLSSAAVPEPQWFSLASFGLVVAALARRQRQSS